MYRYEKKKYIYNFNVCNFYDIYKILIIIKIDKEIRLN